MTEKERNAQVDRLPATSILLYLFIMPLLFTASLHFLDANVGSVEAFTNVKARGEMQRFKYLLASSDGVRRSLLFFSNDTVYTTVSVTNEAFNYSLPVVGRTEMRFIKGKEDNIFKSATEQQYLVS